MYYENKSEKIKDNIIMWVLMVVIILLLCLLIIKLDENTYNPIASSEYNVDLLSTDSVSYVDSAPPETLNNVIKSVVGISKLQNGNTTVLLKDSENKLGLGSGVILTDNGYILTNYHVAGNKYSNCYVTLEDGRVFNGSVVWTDSNIDLAMVKISAVALDYIVLGDSDTINLAEEVYAIGNPIGIEFQRTITKGIISGINRTIKIDEESYMEDLIQTDATINEGNSGGPLINKKGELIGINTAKISDAEGIGFAVPINLIKPILDKFINSGKFEEAYIGIYGYDKEVIPYLDSNLNIDSGVYIVAIPESSPVKSANLAVGDIILEVDNIKINKMNDLKKYVYSKNPNENVKLKIRRQSEELEIEVTLGYK